MSSSLDARVATLAQAVASEQTYLQALTAAAQLYLAPLLQVCHHFMGFICMHGVLFSRDQLPWTLGWS